MRWALAAAFLAGGVALGAAKTGSVPATRPAATRPAATTRGSATTKAATTNATTKATTRKSIPTPQIDRAAVLRNLSDVSAAGISRRFGPDYAFFHKTPEEFPKLYMPPAQLLSEKSKRHWQVGGPPSKKSGDFSSTQGQILYVPTDAAEFGCDRVTISEWTSNCWTESPEYPWNGGKSHPDRMAGPWAEVFGGPVGQPILTARGLGGWSNCGLVVHSSGFIGTSGTVTASANKNTWVAIPKTKIITAISVTNKNEFALVTVADTATGKGQVAVIILTGATRLFAHEWHDAYPGLANVGMLSGMKVLGYVDLPGISFPTSVSAVGDRITNRLNGRDGNAGVLKEYNLSNAEDRKIFGTGGNAHFASSCGFAVVGAKYENKVAFIDLEPLFARVREAYFGTEAAFAKTRDLGPGKQWPPTFEFEPKWQPPVVKVVDVLQPMSVIASLTGGAKACAVVASLDGTATVFKVGGLGTVGEVKEDEIEEVGTFELGKNPCWMSYQKGKGDSFMAVCRGDREIVWFSATSAGGSVTRRLKDARMIDPVMVEQSDTHGVSAHLVTVADFAGKKIINYRVGVCTFATQGGAKYGCGPKGEDETECGGLLEFPGNPFMVSATNVN